MSGSRAVLTAVHHTWEVAVVTALGASHEVHVVRRCADLAELLGTAEAGLADRAVVGAGLHGLDRATVLRLHELGVGVVGLHETHEPDGARDLRRFGVPVVLPADVALADLEEALLRENLAPLDLGDGPVPPLTPTESADAVHRGEEPAGAATASADLRTQGPTASAVGDGASAPDGAEAAPGVPSSEWAEADLAPDPPPRRGRVITVWGPVGSPGRTTVALHLATELARAGETTLLIDADTYGAGIAQALGMLDEAPGLVAAARAADTGTLDRVALAGLAPFVLPELRVLTGLPRPDRWPEVREHALADVIEVARGLVGCIVLDIGFCLEQDEELFFDTRAPRRNGVALRALDLADVVVAVGSADPSGIGRLVRGLDDLRAACPTPPTVVVNGVRAGAVGGQAKARLADALARFAQVQDPVFVPDDRPALDAAMLAGRSLTESHPRSPARAALRDLALSLREPTPSRPVREPARRRGLALLRRRPAR